jgi:hypothetical protein
MHYKGRSQTLPAYSYSEFRPVEACNDPPEALKRSTRAFSHIKPTLEVSSHVLLLHVAVPGLSSGFSYTVER